MKNRLRYAQKPYGWIKYYLIVSNSFHTHTKQRVWAWSMQASKGQNEERGKDLKSGSETPRPLACHAVSARRLLLWSCSFLLNICSRRIHSGTTIVRFAQSWCNRTRQNNLHLLVCDGWWRNGVLRLPFRGSSPTKFEVIRGLLFFWAEACMSNSEFSIPFKIKPTQLSGRQC